jgi:squalene synthase HpnD
MSRLPDPATRGKVAKSSFYLGMRVLPKPEREAMFAVYAFCRDVDDIADDEVGARDERRAALAGWSADIASLYAGRDPGRAAYLADAVQSFGLAQADFEAVIAGMAMDVDGDIRWPDWATLDLYCDRVASAVGRLSVRVFGMDAEPGQALAHHLGRALQLTNILRDIDEDAAIGRLYLPREPLESAGVVLAEVAEVVADPRLDDAARVVADRARAHFGEANRIMAARPRGHLIAPRLMERVYAGVLARMEIAGWRPPRRRARVDKLGLLLTLVRLQLTQ